MKGSRFVVLLFWFLGASFAFAETPAPFKAGEKLTYHFYWGIFMVGSGTFEVQDKPGGDIHRLTFQMKSNDFISTIYPIQDIIESDFDRSQGRSVRFNQDRKEGKHHVWEETFFYYNLKQASTESYISGEKKWFPITDSKTQDKLSVIYLMRSLDWKTRKEASATLGNDKGDAKVVMKRLKNETLKFDDFSPIPTFQVEPGVEYLTGVFKGKKMQVWISDDSFKVPVKVLTKLSFGTISAVLVKVEGVEGWPYTRKES